MAKAVIPGLFTLVFHLAVVATGHAENLIMPQELAEHAEEHGCRQIADFYDRRPGNVNPPFVYGYLPGREEDSAVYWCEKGSKDRQAYVLMFLFKREDSELTRCPRRIEWINRPAGLSIIRNGRLTLDDFVALGGPNKRPPKGIRLTQPAIRSEYDGAEEVFYCYQGRWFVRQRH